MIRTFLIASVLGLSLTAANAQSDDGEIDCDNAETQFAMNQCSGMEFHEADKALNKIWSKARAEMKAIDENNKEYEPNEPSAAENLLKAQRAWIDYRDGQCAAEVAQYAGGSIQPLMRSSCLTNLTEKRTEELQQMIADQ